LLKLFGREYIFKLKSYSGQTILVGGVFWFIVSILLVYVAWFIMGKLYAKHLERKQAIQVFNDGVS
jgi:hypothetical protein